MSDKNGNFVTRLGFAWSGMRHAIRAERSMRNHVLAIGLVIVALIVLRPEALWWALVGLASAGVVAAELINTAVEQLADHLHPDQHPQIRIVKDCAAGAVLVSAIGALLVAVALLVHLVARWE